MITKEKLQSIKALEITSVTHVKSNFLTQGTCRHITPNWVKDFLHESHLWFLPLICYFNFSVLDKRIFHMSYICVLLDHYELN